MKKKYPKDKKRKKITITIDKKINCLLEEYIDDNQVFNKSDLIETLIKNQIKKEINEKMS